MEEQFRYERTSNRLTDAWDALPRGPAIFIATCEADRPTHGAWASLEQPEPYFFAELDLLLSEPDEQQHRREWVVLDQVGLGEAMLPEHLSLSGLHAVLSARRGATR